MPLTTRILNGVIGDIANDSSVSGAIVSFALVNSEGFPESDTDTIDKIRVAGVRQTTSDENGVFTIALWPTDRGSKNLQYLCRIHLEGYSDMQAPLPSGAGSITLKTWSGE